VQRGQSGWTMTAIGTSANGRTFQDLIPAILPAL
jgi:tellurium resistance protein TerZ